MSLEKPVPGGKNTFSNYVPNTPLHTVSDQVKTWPGFIGFEVLIEIYAKSLHHLAMTGHVGMKYFRNSIPTPFLTITCVGDIVFIIDIVEAVFNFML